MENKTARLTVLVDPVKKKAFEELCLGQDITPSQVIRQLMREYMEKHGIEYSTKNSVNNVKNSVSVCNLNLLTIANIGVIDASSNFAFCPRYNA